jgi:3-phosphoshikimate 1-carboxyvinyltransferase
VPWLLDELPALAVAAAFADGRSHLRGASELRVKESDRIEAMALGLRAIGARVRTEEDGWTIEGSAGELLAGGRVLSQGDHRVAMALLVAGFRTRAGVEVMDPPLVETSDPLFPINLRALEEFAA